jgi:hypothetical protein
VKNLAAAVAILLASCASENMATDGDRMLVDQNMKGMVQMGLLLDAAFSGDAEAAGKAIGTLQVMTENTRQLQKNIGLPKEPKDFGARVSEEARRQSEGEHKKKWYLAAGAVILTAGLKILGDMFVPGLGTLASRLTGGIFKGAATKTTEATMAGLEQYMKATPGAEEAVVGYVKRAQEKFGVSKFAGKILAGVKTFILPQLPAGPPEPPTNSA